MRVSAFASACASACASARMCTRRYATMRRYLGGTVDWRRLFEKYDADGSGELDFAEFRMAMRRDGKLNPKHMSDEDLRRVFESIDADSSGVVDADEFYKWCVTVGVHALAVSCARA